MTSLSPLSGWKQPRTHRGSAEKRSNWLKSTLRWWINVWHFQFSLVVVFYSFLHPSDLDSVGVSERLRPELCWKTIQSNLFQVKDDQLQLLSTSQHPRSVCTGFESRAAAYICTFTCKNWVTHMLMFSLWSRFRQHVSSCSIFCLRSQFFRCQPRKHPGTATSAAT